MNYEKRESEVFWLDGVRVSRLLSSADSPTQGAGSSHVLSPDELQQENTRIGEIVRNVLKARLESKPDEELKLAGVLNGIRLSRFLELGTFSNPRRETCDQRCSIVVGYTGTACSQSCGPLDSAAQWITGTLTIDEEDRTVTGFRGNFDQSWKVPGDLSVTLPRDAEIRFSAERIADRLWLPATMSISFDLSKHKRSFYDGEIRWRAETIFLQYTGYKKFRVSSTILH
jgi:hypothetical protein